MIVRLMNEAQYRADESLRERLNDVDVRASDALEAGDRDALARALDEMAELVRANGERVPDEELIGSDLIIPPSDLTLEEVRMLMTDEGLIPDLPAAETDDA